ncbi:MAG TPA: pilin [Candidatus Binatia bacterium]|jgi:hypothetical protein|nr:pilin [Candidatus Binatia bacterium]
MQNPSSTAHRFRKAVTSLALPLLLALPLPGLAAGGVDPLHPMGNTTLEVIIGRVVATILGLLGTLSLAMFVYGGITWMTAAGNEEKIKRAKGTIVYSVFGLIVAFSAGILLATFLNQVLQPALKQ